MLDRDRYGTTFGLLIGVDAGFRSSDALVPLGTGVLVGKTSFGPQLQRAGALQDASRLRGLLMNAPASWTAVALHRLARGLDCQPV
jgi:hypothetical protein